MVDIYISKPNTLSVNSTQGNPPLFWISISQYRNIVGIRAIRFKGYLAKYQINIVAKFLPVWNYEPSRKDLACNYQFFPYYIREEIVIYRLLSGEASFAIVLLNRKSSALIPAFSISLRNLPAVVRPLFSITANNCCILSTDLLGN